MKGGGAGGGGQVNDLVLGPPQSVVELEVERRDDDGRGGEGERRVVRVRVKREGQAGPGGVRGSRSSRSLGGLRQASAASVDPSFWGDDDDSDAAGSDAGDDDGPGRCGVGLGLEKDGPDFRVAALVVGGAAERSQRVHVGDVLRAVDAHPVEVWPAHAHARAHTHTHRRRRRRRRLHTPNISACPSQAAAAS